MLRLPSLWPLLIVALPIGVLFGPALASDTSFAMRDAAHFYYPLFEWTTREWAEGRVPLWNPQENCGMPVIADVTSSVFYPGKLLFALPLDFTFLYKLYIVSHVALAAATAYYLARQWNRSPPAAALAAVAYAGGGSIVFQYCNVVFLVGAAWLPLAVWSMERIFQRPSLGALLLLSVSLALMVLGGDPQLAMHALLLSVLYALILFSRRWDFRVLSAGAATMAVAAVLAFLLAAVQVLPSSEATRFSERATYNRPRNVYEAVTFVLQATENVDAGEAISQSILRGLFCTPPEGSHHDRIYDFSIGPWRLLEFVWPNVGGRMFPINRRWMSLIPAEGRVWSPALYMGLFPIVLAVQSLWVRSRHPRRRWLRWMAVLFTLGSFGYYGLGWALQELHLLAPASSNGAITPALGGLYWLLVTFLPTYAYFRYPAKLLTVAALAISLLAAYGFDDCFRSRNQRLAKTLVSLATASAAAAMLVWLVGGLWIDPIKAIDSTLGPFDGRGARWDIIVALLHTAVVALGTAWLLSRAWKNPQDRYRWKLTAVLLTAVELSIANGWLVVTAPADIWRKESPVALDIYKRARSSPANPAPPRVYRGNIYSWRPPSFAQAGSKDRMAQLAAWEHDTLFPKHQLGSRLALVESYGSIKSADYESLLVVAKQFGKRHTDKSYMPSGHVLLLLGTQWMIMPQALSAVDAPRSPWPETAEIWNTAFDFPRAWIIHDVVALPPLRAAHRMSEVDRRTTEVLFPGGTIRDFSVQAVVETSSPPAEWAAGQRGRAAQEKAPGREFCRLTHYEPQHVVIEAELAQPGLVVLSDTYYAGWRASVSSAGHIEETPIYRTNRVERGVWLPAGRHVIEYFYEPRSVYFGAALSVLSWLFVSIAGAVLFLIRTRSKRRSKIKSSNSARA